MATPMNLQCLDQFPSHIHPLHVLINKSQLTQTFPDCTGPTHALLFSSTDHQSSFKRGFLVCAHVTPEEETNVNNHMCLTVFVSRSFLRHYDLKDNSQGTVRPQSLLPLKKIVIGARTKSSFKWASSEKFSNALLILSSCHGQTLLARQGDVLLLPYHHLLGEDASQVQQYLSDVMVLECTPVSQGRITVDTCVVVSDCRDLSFNDAMDQISIINQTRLAASSLFVSDFAQYANSLSSDSSLLNSKLLGSSDFSAFLQALECRLDVRVTDVSDLHKPGGILSRLDQNDGLDIDSTIFVHKSLLLKLGVFNGEWVIASVPSEKAKKSSKTHFALSSELGEAESTWKFPYKRRGRAHLVSVKAFDAVRLSELDVNDNVGFISPVQWFNLSGGLAVPVGNKAIKIKRWNKVLSHVESQLSASACRSAVPPFAKELHIEAVISPDYNAHGPFDSILYKHFNTPRLVQQGNILGIPSEGHPEFVENNSEGILRWPVLYFKVKLVSGFSEEEEEICSYLADSSHTSLYMGGSTHSLSPCSVQQKGLSFWTSVSTPGLSSTVEQLITIIQPHLSESSATLNRGCSVLLRGSSGSGKVTVVRAASRRLHLHLIKVDCVTLCADTAAACEVKMKSAFERADLHHPCVLLLRNLQLLGQPRDGSEMDSRVICTLCQLITAAHASVVVIGSVSSPRELSSDVMAAFVHQVALESLSEEQRRVMLSSLSEELPLGKDVNLCKIAKQTAGFVLGDLCALLTNAGKAAHRRLLKLYFPNGASQQEEQDLCVSGVSVLSEDFSTALDVLQEAHSHAIGAPKIPSVRWQDVGGLQQVKKEILDTIQLPLDHPELLSLGLRRSGLLLYGPPGTGKTLLAKAVATECSMTFLSVKGPELINMYVGQSEENIREVFSKARSAAPCIIFFDELDSLAPNRGHSGDSGGVMDRVVSQLLAELDGLHSSGDVFVIGATNRPDLLDQSLLRPGRFDKLVYVGISEDRESQLQVLKAILRKFKVDPSVNLSEVVECCPPQLTGADLYALCSDAMMCAIKRKILCINEGVDSEVSALTLCSEDFRQALSGLQPSVSEQQLYTYKLIQQKFTSK
ncbi:peroxisome assembly factor 2 [Myxocyprinus asiaticus]|uniref:peroxisome assembly factor 2 n=1 Tax=Myxocyprinus asiaticus TaxID=70543 RepID=UPI002222B12C|nr:peroxisome assembly factor 2 [Myxocyprinus asiaticus]